MNKQAIATTSTFGAALGALAVAPTLQADIVALTFAPGSVGPQATSVAVNVQIGTTGGGSVGSFQQWNDFIGKTLYAANGFSFLGTFATSSTITAGQTNFGATAINPGSSGTVYIGFNAGGNVGWFSVNLGGIGGTMTYLEGAYGTNGESVHVGTVPAPAGLAVLALGAAGVRRNRKRAA